MYLFFIPDSRMGFRMTISHSTLSSRHRRHHCPSLSLYLDYIQTYQHLERKTIRSAVFIKLQYIRRQTYYQTFILFNETEASQS